MPSTRTERVQIIDFHQFHPFMAADVNECKAPEGILPLAPVFVPAAKAAKMRRTGAL